MPTPLGILSAHRTNTLCTRSRNCAGARFSKPSTRSLVFTCCPTETFFAVTPQLLKMNFQRYTQISFLRLILFVLYPTRCWFGSLSARSGRRKTRSDGSGIKSRTDLCRGDRRLNILPLEFIGCEAIGTLREQTKENLSSKLIYGFNR